MPHHTRARHAEGVPNGDGPAAHVHLVEGDAKLVRSAKGDDGKGLVDLPEVNVLHHQPLALEEAGHGEHGTDAHLVRGAPGHDKALEYAQRFDAPSFRLGVGHDDARRRPVRELASIPRSYGRVRVHICAYGAEAGKGLESGTRAVALVLGDNVGHATLLPCGLVLCDHLHLHGHNLRVKAPLSLRGRHSLLRLEGVLILALAADRIALAHNVSRVYHGHPQLRARFRERWLHLRGLGDHGLHERDGLHPSSDDHRHALMHHCMGRVGDGLEP
mmetsp:Transcript_9321/g.27668  ORF Transcript_9321/g.27668 Transcript_9321/m.27668 type:complete len:273 (+) Transcript_9321:375-1193(+)